MSTLIIHPDDRSTDFLCKIYEGIVDKTVIRGGINKRDIVPLIHEHDQVMLMGHGSPTGLFSMGNFNNVGNHYIIDGTMVEALQTKDNNIIIWCNADQFVNRFNIKGFYTGMFISEVVEAYFCGFPNTKQDVVTDSNEEFVNIVSKYIDQDIKTLYEKVKEEYGILSESNHVANYNNIRVYIRE
jgi:hypothetical protein